ncbi:MAG: hypothetical protein JSU85_15680 [Candidatus Zixiibacteriota bacterium]|nr:MAG: hypothetical protein JSU85_15680 [candidate division Zixibacteria bacterium]
MKSLAMLALVLMIVVTASAQIPSKMSYQGYLTDPSGNPVSNDIMPMLFKIYGDSGGTTPLWQSNSAVVDVDFGYFTHSLGSTTDGLPDTLSKYSELWLGVKVGSDNEMPLVEIVSTAYSFRTLKAQYSDSAGYAHHADTANYAINSAGGVSLWDTSGAVLYTNDNWGIVRGNAGNYLIGNLINTMINFGVSCTTGVASYPNDNFQTIGGGWANVAAREYCTVSGGENNKATERFSTISGGSSNRAREYASTVGGGENNDADSVYATVAGGYDNNARGYAATVSGGDSNDALKRYSTIGGGLDNYISGNGVASTIGGGRDNQTYASHSTIAGGYNNDASGDYSLIPGGENNTASGYCGQAIGCYVTASGDGSLAAGTGAIAAHDGSFVWADFSGTELKSIRNNQFLIGASGEASFYTDINRSSGVMIHPGASSWSTYSGEELKENFVPINSRDILQKISSLPLHEWNFKAQADGIKHIGPTSQDFYNTFSLGESEKTISTVDAGGVALAGIQELIKAVNELKEENVKLKTEINELKQLIR